MSLRTTLLKSWLFPAILLPFLLSPSNSEAAPASNPSNASVTVLVVLRDDPAVHAFLQGRGRLPAQELAAAARSRRSELARNQGQLVPQIEALGGHVSGRFQRLANAVRVQIAPDKLDKLAQLPGVERLVRP